MDVLIGVAHVAGVPGMTAACSAIGEIGAADVIAIVVRGGGGSGAVGGCRHPILLNTPIGYPTSGCRRPAPHEFLREGPTMSHRRSGGDEAPAASVEAPPW